MAHNGKPFPTFPRTSDVLLRTFFDSAPFMMGVVELLPNDVRLIHANLATAKGLGQPSPQAVEGRTIRELGASEEATTMWLRHYRSSHELRHPVSFEYEWNRFGRSGILAVTVSPAHDSSSESSYYCFVAHDVTDTRHAERALAVSEQRLTHALDISDEGFWDWDLQNDHTWLSPKCHEQLGYSDRVTRDLWLDSIHPDDRAMVAAAMDDHLSGKTTSYRAEHRVQHANGEYVWLQARGKVVSRDASGQPLRMIGTQLVVTDRKHTESELQQAKDAAQDASAAKSAFVANVSHEIRTPLTAILGFADVLQDPALPAEFRAQCVETIRKSGRHLLALIDDVLDFSRIEAKKAPVEMFPCDPVSIASEVSLLMRSRAEAKGLAYNVQHVQPLPRVIYTDPTRVRQILMNLVDNAIKFTPSGSLELTLRFDPAQGEGGGETNARPDQPGRLCFDVSDSGIGISQEGIARLFTPFVQADASTTRRFGGTGLGLSISQRLALFMGGGIDVSSTIGKGSRFTFWLPAADPATALSEEATPVELRISAPSHTPERGAHILLMEDSAEIQLLVSHLLTRSGAIVEVAADGVTGISMIRRSVEESLLYDLVLMDVQMPVMDGLAATRLLRSQGIRCPIIALTADAMESSRRACLEAGCDGFFAKPIDMGDLLATIRRHLGRNGTGPRPEATINSIATSA